MVNGKSALVIANSHYQDPDLRQLVAPAYDAEALARVLGNPAIGAFEVKTLLDKPAREVSEEIEKFFLNRRRGDLLLLYFSGHGIKDDDGLLYFATADTRLIEHGRPLRSSAVSADFVKDVMRCSKSRRQVLVLDCCYSGAFASALLAKGDKSVGIKERFAEGRGMVVITASDALQYSFEGDKVEGEAQRSVFTRTLVEGIETGRADLNHDGEISLDELYEYVYEHVSDQTPEQRPKKWDLDIEGKILLAHSPTLTPADLPPELLHAIASPLTRVRHGAVEELGILLRGPHKGLALAAQHALMSLKDDDSRRIVAAAEHLLSLPSATPVAVPLAAPVAVEPPVAPPSIKETPLLPPIKVPLQPAATAAPAKSTPPPKVVEIKQAPEHKVVHLEQVVPAELPPPPSAFTPQKEAPQPSIPPALHKVIEIKQAPDLKEAQVDIPPPVSPASAPQAITPPPNELRVVQTAKAPAQMAEIGKFCTRCGNTLRGTETFCTRCGQAQKPATQKMAKPWKLWKLLVLIFVGLPLLIMLITGFWSANQPSSEPAPQPTSTPAAAMPSPVTTAPAATLPARLPSPKGVTSAPTPSTLSDIKSRVQTPSTPSQLFGQRSQQQPTEAGARAVLKQFLDPNTDKQILTQRLRPSSEDYRTVYREPFASTLESQQRSFIWDSKGAIAAKPGQTELQIVFANTDDLIRRAPISGEFPGGYNDVRQYLNSGIPIVWFRFVEPGKSAGMSYDGLLFVRGRWVFIPKPWRALDK